MRFPTPRPVTPPRDAPRGGRHGRYAGSRTRPARDTILAFISADVSCHRSSCHRLRMSSSAAPCSSGAFGDNHVAQLFPPSRTVPADRHPTALSAFVTLCSGSLPGLKAPRSARSFLISALVITALAMAPSSIRSSTRSARAGRDPLIMVSLASVIGGGAFGLKRDTSLARREWAEGAEAARAPGEEGGRAGGGPHPPQVLAHQLDVVFLRPDLRVGRDHAGPA